LPIDLPTAIIIGSGFFAICFGGAPVAITAIKERAAAEASLQRFDQTGDSRDGTRSEMTTGAECPLHPRLEARFEEAIGRIWEGINEANKDRADQHSEIMRAIGNLEGAVVSAVRK